MGEGEVQVYLPAAVGDRLRQGEIICDLTQALRTGPETVDELAHPFAVVLTQDCDLEQDHTARTTKPTDDKHKAKLEKGQLPNLLLAEVHDAATLRGGVGGSDIWKRIHQNKDERYHFLEAAPAGADLLGQGLPALTIDFKRIFTLGMGEVLEMLKSGSGKRRCRLATPYAEHLSSRYCYFQMRIALPRDHAYVAS